MYSIQARNVNDAYVQGVSLVLREGVEAPSRNGKVIALREPCSIEYMNPRQRVLFDPNRDANPFFHFMEAIWMLAGRRDAAWPTKFNSQMGTYANDEGNYDGAYGYRWRTHFGFDQIKSVVALLKSDPSTRRAVITMYDPCTEKATSKDIPCNTQIFFRIVDGYLDMTVTNRSNDAVWGAFGANAVHFSMLQEVMAAMVGVQVGRYWQVTNNLHIYTGVPKVWEAVSNMSPHDYYSTHRVEPFALVAKPDTFLEDCERFLDDPLGLKKSTTNPLFFYVATPMYQAWMCHKRGEHLHALDWCTCIEASDWRVACIEWLKRRQK